MAPDVQLTRYAMPQQVKYRNKIEIWNSINFQHMFIHIYCQHMWLFTFITIINKNTLMSGHQSGNKSETVSGHTHTHIGRGRGTAISMHTFYTHANRNNMEFELSAQCGCCSLFVCLLACSRNLYQIFCVIFTFLSSATNRFSYKISRFISLAFLTIFFIDAALHSSISMPIWNHQITLDSLN